MPLKTLGPIGPRAVGERVKEGLNFEFIPKNTFSSFCRNFLAVYGWSWNFFYKFPNPSRDKELQHRLSSWSMLSKYKKNLPGIHLKVSLQKQKLSDPWSLYVIRNAVNWPYCDSLQQLLIFQDVRSRLPHTVYLLQKKYCILSEKYEKK